MQNNDLSDSKHANSVQLKQKHASMIRSRVIKHCSTFSMTIWAPAAEAAAIAEASISADISISPPPLVVVTV